MFIPKINSLDKTRFGVNFKIEDIKCKLNKEKNKLDKLVKNNDSK